MAGGVWAGGVEAAERHSLGSSPMASAGPSVRESTDFSVSLASAIAVGQQWCMGVSLQ